MQIPPPPPFTRESALAKVRAAEDAWNSRDPQRVALMCSPDSEWRNRDRFFRGRDAIVEFLTDQWKIELHFRLRKDLWAYAGNRISVRFESEWQDARTGQWYRTHGNEHWAFDADGCMYRRDVSANDIPISADERQIQKQISHTSRWRKL